MPRSPYQGTWQSGIRPTVVTSPDALVYINGEIDILGCARCRRKFDWNKYITAVQVDLSVESSPGSASITLSVPRHSVDEFYFDSTPLITPMMEVEIFAKGYFLIEGMPQYYPIFWGLVTEVTEDYASGEHTFTINCADILKWWELCKMNVNPAFTQGAGQMGKSIYGNVLFGTNPYDLIWTLAQQSFGDVVIGTGGLISLYKEAQQRSTFNAATQDIMAYWQNRFSRIRSNLMLYGTQGNAVRGDALYAEYKQKGGARAFASAKHSRFASQEVRQANGGDSGSQEVFDPTDPGVTAFRTQFSQAGQVNFWQSEFQTKLEIANACKEAIGFEFYMDVTGDIVFKPPFYNLDILSNKPVSWIQDIDIIDWNLADSESEVVTQIQLQGSFGGNVDYGFGEEATPGTSVTDYHLLRKYGWRTQTFNSEFMSSPQLMFYTGLDMLDRTNAKRWNGTVNIPLRPELRLGFPIYLAPKDQIWYVQGISHNIQFGGRAQTTVSLTARRGKFQAPRGIGTIELSNYNGSPVTSNPSGALSESNYSSRELAKGATFKAEVGAAASTPPDPTVQRNSGEDDPYAPLELRHPRTGRVVGFPNVVMAYTRPFQPPPETLAAQQGRRKGPRPAPEVIKQQTKEAQAYVDKRAQEAHTYDEDERVREKLVTNRYSYGLNSAGVYAYLHDTSKVIREILILPKSKVSFSGTDAGFATSGSGMIRPVSDERGFEVIGHFRYGRGVSLRDGSLVLTNGGNNEAAQIQTQVALGGGLYETLQAQSSGLTTKPLYGTNPAYAIATLNPDEDLQTAGTMTPEGTAEYANTPPNFMAASPLNSPGQQGSNPPNDPNKAATPPSVEASQLSRALTLAEMGVRDDAIVQADCDCVTGRGDLAFISVGYQLQTLRVSQSDNSTIGFGSMSEEASRGSASYQEFMTEFQAGHDEAVATAKAEARSLTESDPLFAMMDPPERNQALAEAEARAEAAASEAYFTNNKGDIDAAKSAANAGLYNEALAGDRPISASATLSREEMVSKVESFLVNLYTALDAPHQEYEKALRGELVKRYERTPEQVRFDPPKDFGGVSPPYGPGSRGLGGDPEALALLADSAVEDIESTWNEFGDDLAESGERVVLENRLRELQEKAAQLAASIHDLIALGLPTEALEAERDQTLNLAALVQHRIDVMNND